ncbi:MAG: hypothetical protein KC486_24055 [Myxococcales bacterium]|nr:hypothetical protein [Myxococcales bacterium]
MLKPEHLRWARHLLGWTVRDLSNASLVGETTIRRFEIHGEQLRERTLLNLKEALERAGIEFTEGKPGPTSIRCEDGMTLTLVRKP